MTSDEFHTFLEQVHPVISQESRYQNELGSKINQVLLWSISTCAIDWQENLVHTVLKSYLG
jgi:hypothetical protein